MANSDGNKSGGGSSPGRKHRDAAPPLPPQTNPQPAGPGQFAPVEGSQVFDKLKASGRVEPNWAVDQPAGGSGYPAEVGGDNPPPLAQFIDPSPPKPADPSRTLSPPAPMGTHPHLVERKKR